jgi:hypothetical protein
MRRQSLLCALLFLTSCVPAPAPLAAPTSIPHWLPTQIPASGLIYLPLESTGTPEAHPMLLVEAAILDAVTHQPVAANVYLVHDELYREPTPAELVLSNTGHFELKLLAQFEGWLVVRAPGYADWTLRLHYHLKTTRKLSGPIQMHRLASGSQTATFGHRWTAGGL